MIQLDFSNITPEAERLILSVLTLAVIYLLYKLLIRLLRRTGERLELEPHALNALRLLLRVAAVTSASSVLFIIYKVPTTAVLSGSAIIGAAIGFGSSQTINNVVAGFYVLVTQPFKVKDYVIIGDFEGQVEEITINYTNLYTPSFNLLKVPNTQVMNSRILNLTHEGFIKYTFTVGFSHDLPNEVVLEKVIQPAIIEFHKKHEGEQLRTPEAYMDDSDRLGRTFLIRFFVPKGEAKTLYVLQPELLDMIMRRWDHFKN